MANSKRKIVESSSKKAVSKAPKSFWAKTNKYKNYIVILIAALSVGLLSYGSYSLYTGNTLNLDLNWRNFTSTPTYTAPTVQLPPVNITGYQPPSSTTTTPTVTTSPDLSVVQVPQDAFQITYFVEASYNSTTSKINLNLNVADPLVKSVTYTITKPTTTAQTVSTTVLRPTTANSTTYKFPKELDASNSTSYPTGEYTVKARIVKTDNTIVNTFDAKFTIPLRLVRLEDSVVLTNPGIIDYTVVTPTTTTPPVNLPRVAPQITSPTNNQTSVSLTPQIRWTATNTTVTNQLRKFEIQVATDSNYTNVVYENYSIDKSSRNHTIPAGKLANNTRYYVKVTANNYDNLDVVSYIFDEVSFVTVAATTPPVTPPPVNGDTQVSFARSASSVDEDDDYAYVAVVLNRALSYDLKVYYSIKLESTADHGTDYRVSTDRIVTFRAGETSKNIQVQIIDDKVRENDETVVFKLSVFGFTTYPNTITIGSTNEHKLTIKDNESGSRPSSGGSSSSTKSACEKYFIDMDRYDALCNEVAELRELGIFLGQETSKGRVANLDAQLRRSEYFAIAARILNRSSDVVDKNYLSQFRDLSSATIADRANQWWLAPVSSLKGIVRGYGDGTLQPARVTTEAEISKIALEAVFTGFRNRDTLNPWYLDTLNFMADFGYYADPVRAADRGDAVEIIYIIIQAEKDINSYRSTWR